MGAAAEHLAIAPEALEAALFADLPGERIVRAPEQIPSVEDAACRVNLVIAQRLLFRASIVRIRAEGAMRPVVRHARLRGLLCTISAGPPPVLEVSGPFALFRRTLLYGRSLAELLPFLARTARFELVARCVLGGQDGVLCLRSGDLISPAAAPKTFDSKLEERFARSSRRRRRTGISSESPSPCGPTMRSSSRTSFCATASTRPGASCSRSWDSGPRTTSTRSSRGLRAAGIHNLILAVDEERRCADGEMPAGARVVQYRRRVDPQQILALLS